MNDKNASHVHDGKKTTSLLHLPDEMILYICSFLHTSVLLGLSLVCKRFYKILKKNTFISKARTQRIWLRSSNPLFQPGLAVWTGPLASVIDNSAYKVQSNELFWKLSRMAIKKIVKWQFPEKKLLIANAEYEMMDALLLMHAGTTCVASTRERSLLYYKTPYWKPFRCMSPKYIKSNAHNERICDLTAIDNTIYSCSLDQSVKSWMFINTGLFEQRTYELSGSDGLLCVSSCPERGLFATGSYNRTIFIYDSRLDMPIRYYWPHTGAVIKLAMNSEYILSASEDKTVSVWDQRAGRIMKKSITISGGGVPTCINVQRDWVCVGDSIAKLHLLDLKYDFEVKSYSTEHIGKITGVHMTDEYLITTASADRNVIFSSLTDPPQPIVKLSSDYKGHSRMAYLNDTLAVSELHDITVWSRK